MKSKSLSLFVTGIFALVLFLNFASAAISFSNVPTLSNTPGAHTATITIATDKNETINITSSVTVTEGSKSFVVNFSPVSFGLNGTGRTIDITYNVPSDFPFLLGKEYSVTLSATGTVSATNTQKILFTTNNEFCEVSNLGGNLDIAVDLTNKGYGDDDVWYPLDEIEVEVNVENEGNEKIRNIVIEYGLWSTANNDWVGKKYKESDFDLSDGKDKTLTFTYTLDKDLSDLDSGDFIFYVRATGEDEEFSDADSCVSESQTIEIPIEEFVVLKDFEFMETAQCGNEFHVSADVWNIGDEDQEEVSVRVYNSELGIDQKVAIGDIDAFDSQKLDVTVNIPSDVSPKSYGLYFEVFDESLDIYVNEDDDESKTNIIFRVDETCSPSASASVSGEIQSGGKAGEDLVVKITVTNTGKALNTFTLNPTGYTDWASSVQVNEPSIILAAGASQDVLFTFKTKDDVSGNFNFNTETLASGKVVTTQPFSVTLEKSWLGGFNFKDMFGDNWYLWLIGALNVLLVVVIIIVAIRIARK